MGFWPIVGQTVEPIKAIGGILDELFTSKEEKLNHEAILLRLRQQPHLAQAAINRVEAGHRSIFVAGWRPFIGWVCGFSLAWHFVIFDLSQWILMTFRPDLPPLPKLVGTGQLITIVLSLLGLGGLRTFEKYTGRAK